jgi:hypothetical protein
MTFYPYGFIQGSYLSQAQKTPHRRPVERRQRGAGGLSRLGKELIEDGLIHLWHLGRSLKLALVFWTITMPTHYKDGSPLTEDDHKLLLLQWSDLMKRIFEELGRLQQRSKLPKRHLFVIEPQEKRFRNRGEFAPHAHAVIVNRWNPLKRNPKDRGFQNSGDWEITTNQTDNIVERIFSNALGRSVDCSSSCQLESIKNNFDGLYFYLTKLGKVGRYISKGSKMLDEMAAAGWEEYFPRSWYGSDRETRDTVRASVTTFDLGETNLADIEAGLKRESLEHQWETGHPLFTDPYLIRVEDLDCPVALTARVYRLEDIPAATEAILGFDRNINHVHEQSFQIEKFA